MRNSDIERMNEAVKFLQENGYYVKSAAVDHSETITLEIIKDEYHASKRDTQNQSPIFAPEMYLATVEGKKAYLLAKEKFENEN